MGTPQDGARTVPVRSAWAGLADLEKGEGFGPDDPRTGTVRGPMRRDVPGQTETSAFCLSLLARNEQGERGD